MKKVLSSLVLAGGLLSGSAYAAGLNVDLQNARATGMASAVTANAVGPSAVYFNPANIVTEEHALNLEAGDTPIVPNITFTPAGSAENAVTNVVPPFNAYATYGITKDLAVGFGAFEPYGLKVGWNGPSGTPTDFVGRFLVQSADLKTFFLNPELAYRFGILKIGAGVQVVRGTVELKRSLNFLTSEGQIDFGGAAWGVGGNAGLQAEILPGVLSLGATYRSRVKLDFTGNAHFSNVPTEFTGTGNGQIHDQHVEAVFWLPDQVNLGLSFQPIPALRINVDANYFAWQLFHNLTITFDDPSLNQVQPKNWNHTINYHFGAEYDLTPTVAVRAGLMIDPSPSPADTLTPDVPDASRINIAAGFGYHANGFTADLGGQYIIFQSKTSTFAQLPGDYGGHVVAVGFSFGYTFNL